VKRGRKQGEGPVPFHIISPGQKQMWKQSKIEFEFESELGPTGRRGLLYAEDPVLKGFYYRNSSHC